MSPTDQTNEDILREELQSAIAAARELGPEMDRQLADSVLERYRSEVAARDSGRRSQMATERSDSSGSFVARRKGSGQPAYNVAVVAGLIAFATIMIVNPGLWWLIFLLPGLCGGWGWRHLAWGAR